MKHRIVPMPKGIGESRRRALWRCVWCNDVWKFPPDHYDHCPNR